MTLLLNKAWGTTLLSQVECKLNICGEQVSNSS